LTDDSSGQSPIFRETLIRSNPDLADHVICRSKSLKFKHDDYFQLSLKLLSLSLPPNFQLPGSADDFISHVATEAITAPSYAANCRLYDLLSGGFSNLHTLLDPNQIHQLEHKLIGVLPTQNSKPQDNRPSTLPLGTVTHTAPQESGVSKYF
jgi:hypothetical protein